MTKPAGHNEFTVPTQRGTHPAKPGGRSSQDTLRELAAFHMLYGQIENADRLLKIALWTNPHDGRSKRLLAHSMARRGQPMDAARTLIEASKLPDVSVSYSDWKEVALSLLLYGHSSLGMKLLGKKKAGKKSVRITDL